MCQWSKKDLDLAKGLVGMTLTVLKNVAIGGESSDDNSAVVESASALLHNPDLISSDSVVNALQVFDSASQRFLTTPDVAATAFGSISNLLFVSSALRVRKEIDIEFSRKSEQLQVNEEHKKFSVQMLGITDNFMDGVSLETFDELGEKGLTINTRLIKARKVQILDPESNLKVKTSDSDEGISVGEGLLEELIED